jgi:hypothetical protein
VKMQARQMRLGSSLHVGRKLKKKTGPH